MCTSPYSKRIPAPCFSHLTPWFVCVNCLSDETKLRGCNSTNQEEEKEIVVAGMWSAHLELKPDIVISDFIFRPSESLTLLHIILGSLINNPVLSWKSFTSFPLHIIKCTSETILLLSHCSAGHPWCCDSDDNRLRSRLGCKQSSGGEDSSHLCHRGWHVTANAGVHTCAQITCRHKQMLHISYVRSLPQTQAFDIIKCHPTMSFHDMIKSNVSEDSDWLWGNDGIALLVEEWQSAPAWDCKPSNQSCRGWTWGENGSTREAAEGWGDAC